MSRIKLIASEGMVFTDGEACGKIIYLGTNDKPESWYEITEKEYDERVASEKETI